MANATTKPILENEYVRELLAALKETDATTRTALVSVLAHIGKMETQYTNMVTEIPGLRQELAEAERQRHPIKNAMQNTIIGAQARLLDFRDALMRLKQTVIDGCRAAIATVQETGISALNHVTQFLKIRPLLENMRNNADKNIRLCDRRIAETQTMSEEYHKAGRHLKNIGRAFLGKEPIQEAKPMGKLAGAHIRYLQNERAGYAKTKSGLESALNSLKRLEDRAAGRRSIKADLQTYSQVAQAQQSVPTHSPPTTNAR